MQRKKTFVKATEPLTLDDGQGLVRRKANRYPEWIAFLFTLLLFTFFPLSMGGGKYTTLTEFKYICFQSLTIAFGVTILLCLCLFLLDRKLRDVRLKEGRQRLSLPQIFLLAYLATAILSALFSPYEGVWKGLGRFEGLYTIFLYCALFFLVSFFSEYSKYYIYGFSAIMIPFCVLAILQYAGVDALGLYPEGRNFANSQFLTTIGNVDMVSGMLSLAIPVAWGGYILLQNKWKYPVFLISYGLMLYLLKIIDVDSGRIGVGVAVIVLLPFLAVDSTRIKRILELGVVSCLVLVFARSFPLKSIAVAEEAPVFSLDGISTLLLAAAGLLMAIWLVYTFAGNKIRISPKVYRIALSALMVVCLVAGVIWLYGYQGENRLLGEASQFLHGELADNAGSGRGYVWKKAVAFIKERPLLGSGPDTFIERFEPFNDEYNQLYGSNVYFDYAHNDFLQVGVNLGLVGLAAYVGFLVSLAVRAFRRANKNPLILLFGGSMLCYLAHSFFSFSIPIITPVFWVMAGLLEKCIRQTPED